VKFVGARRAALGVFVSLALAPAAHAQDAGVFASKLGAIYSAVGYDLKFGAATTNGSTITYDGLDMTFTGTGTPAYSYKLGSKLTFSGVKAGTDGSYTADSLTLPDMDFKVEDTEVSIKNIAFNHIYLPATKTPGMVDMAELIGDATIGPITVTASGAKAATIDQVTLKNAFTPAQGDAALSAIVANAVASGINVDLTAAKDPDSVAQAKALNLSTITGKGVEAFSWSLKDGHLNANEISLGFDNIGKIKFAFDITGYTPALLETLIGAEKSLASSGAGAADDSGKQTALLLGSLQSVFLNSVSLRYDDASITNKLLDYTAKQQNTTKDALIDQIVMGAGGAMNQGASGTAPDPMTLLSQAALRAFLNNPQSIEVKLAPKTPLGVLGIVGAAMAPDSLADQIGLQVLVNDKQVTPADTAAEAKRDADAAASAPAAPADTTTAPADDSSTAPSDDSTTAPADSTAGSSSDSSAPASDGTADKLSSSHSK
jgi:hypothetical protein